jgi:uncharacterized protein (UPF0335 family)
MTAQSSVTEFIEELTRVENEMRLLKEDRKSLIDSYKDKINTKAMMAAIKIAKIRAKLGEDVGDCDTYLDEVDGRVE